MDSLALTSLKQYGLMGFIIVTVLIFCGSLFKTTLIHFMKNIEKKDADIKEMGTSFATALNLNTSAIHRLSETMVSVSNNTSNLMDRIDRSMVQSNGEHVQILEYVREVSM